MLKIILALCTLLPTFLFAQSKQDIVIKTRFDLESSEVFIKQVRILLANSQIGDPYSQELNEKIVVDLGKIIEDVPRDTQNWVNELQSVLKLRFFDSSYKLIVDGLAYSLQDFNAEIVPGTSVPQRIEFVTQAFVKAINLKARSVSFEVELQKTLSKKSIKFKIQLVNPEFVIHPDLFTELSLGWITAVAPNNIELILNSIDVSKMFEQIAKNPHLVSLGFQDLVMPDVSIVVGEREVSFDQDKIEAFLSSRKNEMKKAVIDLLSVKMHENFKNVIKNSPKKMTLPRTFSIDSAVKGVFDVNDISLNQTGITQFDIGAYFCDDSKNLISQFICNNRVKAKVRRDINDGEFQRSIRLINRKLIEKKSNIAVSVSEDYLNNIVEATIRTGLWDKNFEGKDFKLGPEKSFILAEEKGKEFSLFLDIIYKLKGAQRILVGRSEFRFPAKLMIALTIEEDADGIPHFIIKVKRVVMENDLFINGAPQFGLPSTVGSIPRFRNKVLEGIREEISTFDQKILVDFELPVLKGTYLNKLDFSSDGLGRATATLGFKE